MNFSKFKLLMWKNYCLRRQHWFFTLMELCLPVLFVYVAVMNSSLTAPISNKQNEKIYEPMSRQTFIDKVRTVHLYYTPPNPAIVNFMDQIKSYKYFASINNCTDDSELETTLNNDTEFVGISFKNILSSDSLPDKLSYELRNSDKWNTRILYPLLKLTGPYKNNPYFHKSLSPVQLLINENFIRLKTQNTTNALEFEWFPYPEYVTDGRPRSRIVLNISSIIEGILIFVSAVLIIHIIEEKGNGVKELIKLTGMDEWMMWCSWFVYAFVVSFVSLSIVAIISTCPLNGVGSEVIHFVDFSVLWAFLILYLAANISFCFMFSSIFQNTSVASSVFLGFFMVLVFGMNSLATKFPYSPLLKLQMIIPIGAFNMGIDQICYYETHGIKFTWNSGSLSESDTNSLLFCMFMLVLDTFLYFFLAYYITSINPGKFGARKSPLFIFESLLSRYSKNDFQTFQNLDDKVESEFFESPPTIEATIQIKDLHKHFGLVHAVRGVNLNIYPGELTALLGHNGAGKTATMSIITGLTSPNSGSVHFKNIDVFKNMEKFRQNLGMCSQENRTLHYLTVLEHLEFFGQLKGVSQKAALDEANEYLIMMEMQEKKNSLVKELSGGMKRKLNLCIALMGKPQVLVLDEPTSGIDVQSRRKVWDVLLALRGERTIIFTTHHTAEADALGDRIAIMDRGVIVCHGTPIFLKKVYDTGYELTITKSEENSLGIENAIKKILPDTRREFETSKEIVYKLPLAETGKFPTLFKSLEGEMEQLGIENMGVAATTMEHVFLKVGGVPIYDAKANINTTVTDSIPGSNNLHYTKGMFLYFQQISAILKKKYLYTKRDLTKVFSLIFLPMLVGLSILRGFEPMDFGPEPSLDLSMSTYPDSTIMIRNTAGNDNFAKHLSEYVSEKGGSLVNTVNTTIEKALLKLAEDIFKYDKNYLSAFELNETMTKILYNPPLIHSLPITITTYSNVVLRSLTNSNRYQIDTINNPVNRPQQDSLGGYLMISTLLNSVWFLALGLYTVVLMGYFIEFVNMERIDGFQHIQMMSNVSPFIYWFGTLIYDVCFFLLVIAARVLGFQLINDTDFLSFDPSLGVFLLISTLYGICGLLFSYVIGHLISSKNKSSLIGFFDIMCCYIVCGFYEAGKLFDPVQFDRISTLFYVARALILVVPASNFSLSFIKLMAIFNSNSSCNYCSDAIRPKCEAVLKKKSYLVFASIENPDGLLLEVIFLMVDIVLYSAILSLISTGYVGFWFNSLKICIQGTETTNRDQGDDDVQQEYSKVQQYKVDKSNFVLNKKSQEESRKNELPYAKIIENIPMRERNRVALVVDGLRKNYNWSKRFTAASNVSFIVEPGECFGLLGVNGAGKSTTFKMLTAEIVPTLGDSSIETIKLSADRRQYLSMAGYCPQTNCFIERLTGREILTMITALRGVSRTENKTVVDKWINIIGLEEYQNERCSTYSGGNKRKLGTAMSLIGDPRVVFLDEPTSGVDPISRRNLYDVMAHSKAAGQAVILTSHSMEECETLCDRLTIMVSGVMKCIGSTQHLKKRYAQGFSGLIKINDISNFDEKVAKLKQNMTETFTTEKDCILKDEHRGLLYYQIKDTSLPWSTLFEKMEALKHLHQGLVEDYILTDTTLEEVFISFAKKGSPDPV